VTDGKGALLGAEALRGLADQGRVDIEPGLTEVELDVVEQQYGFEFADDHRSFLAAGLPVGRGWPNWRDGRDEHLRERLAWPVEGVLFDVEHNVFWHSDWGVRPVDLADALAVAREWLATVPQMVPVYSHRYLPAGRDTFGHPILSMYQTDIIVYGLDLVDYIYQEFGAGTGIDRTDARWQPHVTVAFWREFLE
jgi:hypothetical protein